MGYQMRSCIQKILLQLVYTDARADCATIR